MRPLHIILLFVSLSCSVQAQYFVVNVKDTVYNNNDVIKPKDKIGENAKLRFSSSKAFAYVMSPGKGYYILGIKDRNKQSKGEFILALKDALLPPNEYYAAATRTYEPYESMQFEDQYDLKAFFRDELFFMAPAKFSVSAKNFPLDATHFFTVRHYLRDGWFARPLPHSAQQFELSQRVLQLHDKVFSPDLILYSELYYTNQETGEEQYLGRFKLQFLASDAIQEELKSLYEAVGQIPAELFLREHAMPYLHLQYGKTQPGAIVDLINSMQKK